MKYKLTKEEINIEKNAESFVEISKKEKKELNQIIDETKQKKAITLRINENDLGKIKLEAQREGIPYQTFITSILHKYITYQLVDEKVFNRFKGLLTH